MHDLEHFRPINHAPVWSRIKEKIVKEQLVKLLTTQNFINSPQRGFPRGWSCLTHQFGFLNLITQSAASHRSMLFLDLSKAFDRVCHSRLQAKVRTYEKRNPFFPWLLPHLSDLFQAVDIGWFFQLYFITGRVIQDSVPFPPSLLLYFNDVIKIVCHGTPIPFSDDIKTAHSFETGAVNSNLALTNE